MAPIDVQVSPGHEVQHIAIRFGLTDGAACRCRLKMGHQRRRRLESLQARRTDMIEAAVAVIRVLKVVFQLLTGLASEPTTSISTR